MQWCSWFLLVDVTAHHTFTHSLRTPQNPRRHLGRAAKTRRILKTGGSQTQPAGPAAHIWQDTRKDPQQHSTAPGCEAPEFSPATCQKFQTAHVIIYSSLHFCHRVHSRVFLALRLNRPGLSPNPRLCLTRAKVPTTSGEITPGLNRAQKPLFKCSLPQHPSQRHVHVGSRYSAAFVGTALFKLSRFSKHSRRPLTFSSLLKLKYRTMHTHLRTKHSFSEVGGKRQKKVLMENHHHWHQNVLQLCWTWTDPPQVSTWNTVEKNKTKYKTNCFI